MGIFRFSITNQIQKWSIMFPLKTSCTFWNSDRIGSSLYEAIFQQEAKGLKADRYSNLTTKPVISMYI